MKQKDFANKDLGKIHSLITDMFKWPQNEAEWKKHRLTDEQLKFYEEYGYVAGVQMLETEQIEILRKELADLVNPAHPGNHLFYEFHSNESGNPDSILFHALGAWRITEGFHDVLWNPAFLVPATQLLQGSVRFWHDQLFYKPAKHGGVVAWHQDYSYWTRTQPMAHLTCWIGLDDADRENGCLYYVPASHKWGLIQKPELAGDMKGVFQYLNESQKAEFKPIPIELKAGFASFHHPLLMHGSYENKTDRPRRAFVLNAFKDGVLSNSNEEVLKGVPVVKQGEKMEGDYFPLLFQVK